MPETFDLGLPELGDDALINASSCIVLGYRLFCDGQRELARRL